MSVIKYTLALVVSTIFLLTVLGSGIFILLNLDKLTQEGIILFSCVACGGVFGLIAITPLRQRLRDEYEYDEDGISKKHGKFSQLSAAERKRIEQEKMVASELILSSATFNSMCKPGAKDPEAALDKLVGLPRVKEKVDEMKARMEFEKANKKQFRNKEKNPMHMVFFGPPGTGKTTVARIMTGLLYKYGYIKKNQCVECDGDFFRGKTSGESSKRAAALIQRSKGGVLFIDEAYSLLDANARQGQEVIATIVKAMEDEKDDIVIILAGYDKEMTDLINSNPGIESRVKHYMYFGNYSLSDMDTIFTMMAGEAGFCVSAEAMNLFNDRMIPWQNKRNFGNARTIRNLLDMMIDRHALNVSRGLIEKDDKFKLLDLDMPEDDSFNEFNTYADR